MSDSYSDPQQQGGQNDGGRGDSSRGGQRGGRGGNREGGGFRIRLSDNEMRSARALQEAFNLRSTVAVLGFAVRTLGQMLEDGQLDELVAQQRSQAPRGGGRRDGGGRGRRFDDDRQGGRGSRPDPFARPAKPQPSEPVAAAEAEPAAVVDEANSAPVDGDTSTEASDDTKPAEAEA
ncbi:MAG: hypothetical protein CMN91_02465 [Synechococcus sp. ARS1019]|nr:hypothetical protein [Synechococcus sp. ARS1019]|tara:strand:+ start:2701 stop:3231 length:531 start_codon:yes stop_codon:yes gene_type:complete